MLQNAAGVYITFLAHPNDRDAITPLTVGQSVVVGWADTVNTDVEKINAQMSHAAKGEAEQSAPRETKPKRAFKDLSYPEQAGIRANDWHFQDFLGQQYAGVWRNLKDAAACIREICGVTSRAELRHDTSARRKWEILDTAFQVWLTDALYAESVRR